MAMHVHTAYNMPNIVHVRKAKEEAKRKIT
jgi:hypothetical protein